MVKLRKQGFTLVELLVVLVIIAILAAVAVPLYLSHTRKAKASEAVATMGLIRQAERDYKVNRNTYFDVVAATDVGNVQRLLPTSVDPANGTPTPPTAGVEVDAGTSQYFSNGAFTVEAAGTGALSDVNGESNLFVNPDAQEFIIRVNGATTIAGLFGANRPCASGFTGNCSVKGIDASTYRLEMDNSGRTFVSYDGTNWGAY